MTLDEFIDEQKELLVAFEKYWRKMMKSAPDDFPLSMDEGDWDEQLLVYDEDREE
jgi:hypothetical protein